MRRRVVRQAHQAIVDAAGVVRREPGQFLVDLAGRRAKIAAACMLNGLVFEFSCADGSHKAKDKR